MAFSFFVDGKHYEFVVAAQSGEVVHQRRLSLPRRADIDNFVAKMLEQNRQQQDELRRFLGPVQDLPATLGDQIESGQLRVQLGPSAGGVGSARAPKGKSPYQKERPESLLFSSAMRELLTSAGISEAERAALAANGISFLGSGGSHQAAGASPGPGATVAIAGGAGTASSVSGNGVSRAGVPAALPNDHKLVVELAGRSRCGKQKLAIDAIGSHSGERAELAGPRFDFNHHHRSVVEFKGIPDRPRNLQLVIPTSGPTHQIRLPLVEGVEPSAATVDKAEWETVLVPVKPLAYINKQKRRELTDMLKPGYVYVFWRGRLWRELEVGSNHALRDVDVAFYREKENGDSGQHIQRKAEGHWLHDVWVPYKLNGEVQNGILMLYSETQLDMSAIQNLEADSSRLNTLSTNLDSITQYSQQQNFQTGSGDVDSIDSALLDQNIDCNALGYQIISEKGRQLNYARQNNIPVAYLAPSGNRFRLQLKDGSGKPLGNVPIVLGAGDDSYSATTDHEGHVEIHLSHPLAKGELNLHVNGGDDPSHKLPCDIEPQTLPDVSTVKGQQLRLNNLGYNAGVVDGINGRRTRSAACAFQKDHQLEVDGIIGPQTQRHLKEVYGQ